MSIMRYSAWAPHAALHDELKNVLDRFVGEGEWQVPAGHYFVMGDNRDNSEDGRLWPQTNFLPEENLRGKAFLVWLNCEGWFCKGSFDPSRIGTRIQ